MTKITPKSKKKNKSTPKNIKMSKIPLKSKKRPKYSLNLKMTKITMKCKKWLKFPRNLKSDQNTPGHFLGLWDILVNNSNPCLYVWALFFLLTLNI